MFFTRSIRRKLVLGLSLVMTMLLILFAGGISNLLSYREVVHNLDESFNQSARRADLASAITPLFEPLLADEQGRILPVRVIKSQLNDRTANLEKRLEDYRYRLLELPRIPSNLQREAVIVPVLNRIDDRIRELQQLSNSLPASNQPLRDNHIATMIHTVASLETLVEKIPDPEQRLIQILNQAREDYRAGFLLVCSTSAIAFALFVCFVLFGYRFIFQPIKKLHTGTRRVAQGAFDYRVNLSTNDEMAELADSFNQMTSRFQEIKLDLDQQVEDRCQQLIRSERLADVGMLAAGVAHEINNPLSIIFMTTGSLVKRIEPLLKHAEESDSAVIERYLKMIQDESYRCKDITSRLLDFTRGQNSARGQFDLTAIVQDVVSMIGHMRKFRSHNIIFSHSEACLCEMNGAEIKQVVLNVVSNALESMEKGGTLQIAITVQTDQATLTFTDEGCGLEDDAKQKIFEPFYTQRKDGKGTGLGLGICHRIVSDHNGTIEIESPGRDLGTTVRIQLPKKATHSEKAA